MASLEEIMDPQTGTIETVVMAANSEEVMDAESQNVSDGADVRSISDDQKLFLKVLENLKNAVNTKPDNKSVALPKKAKDSPQNQGTAVISKAFDDTGISRTESFFRSDTEEPGTTTVTVSDKTKSLILQKLAVANEVDKTKLGTIGSIVISSSDSNMNSSEHVRDKTEYSTASNQNADSDMKVELVKVTVVGFDNSASKVSDKDILSATKVNKENVDFQIDKIASTSVSPKLGRLIAPATPSVKLFTCNFCDYYSENKNYLKQHIDLVHNSDRPFKCPYCDYAGKRSHALREHLIVHSNERPYQCKSCNATFRKKGHLTNHIKLHNSKRLVKCPLCKVLVYDTGENGLDVHLLNDHDTERLYGCDLCDHIAANEPGILKHLNEKHKSKIGLHKCEKCPFQTANKVDFEGHVQAHNITESNIQVGNNASTKIIGVATIPAGSHTLGLPNSTVKLNPKQDDTHKQPAVIKPVWIKCSECGFTGQDSEVIRKHMIEHLKEQYGMDMDTDELPFSPQPGQAATATPAVSKPNTQPPTPKASVSAPILVPVSKKLDMNAPVLVPVSDAILLKSLQSVPVSVVQLAPTLPSQAAAKSIHSGSDMPRNVVRNVSSSNIVTLTQSNVTINPAISKSVQPLKLVSNMPMSKPDNTQMSEEARRVPAQLTVAQKLPASAGLKLVPVKQSAISADGTMLTNSLNVKMSIIGPSSVVPSSVSKSVIRNFPGGSLPAASSKPETISSFTLTEIPVPRQVNTNEIPKLPPEFVQHTPKPVNEKSTVEATETGKAITEDERMVKEQEISALQEGIANVQKLIDQHEEYSRQTGNAPLEKLDSRGIPEKTDGQKVVYYMSPVGKHNTSKNKTDTGFTHDNTAGRFRCTLCGYTCEYQRTIKAHIWKHSGNKDIYYPMFQNGPLSIYEDGNFVKSDQEENIIEIPAENVNENTSAPVQSFKVVPEDANVSDGNLPSFIVYEQSKISNVAPALAQLIAARTMVGLKDSDKVDDVTETSGESGKKEHFIKVNDNISVCVTSDQLRSMAEFQEMEKKKQTTVQEDSLKEAEIVPVNANVIVEAVQSISTTGFTGLQSQQSSPRVTPAPKSPDSGVSEQTVTSKQEEHSVSSGFISPLPNFDYIADDSRDGNHKFLERTRSQTEKRAAAVMSETDEDPLVKKAKVSNHEDSAVTLLSLLKKGPNYNPACPPKSEQLEKSPSEEEVIKPGQEDTTLVAESDASGSKPKSGISTSLLAVIEQLRERSKTEPEDDKLPGGQQGKRQSKRRSRKSSLEDNAPATGIDNVEEFVTDGIVKFRCKLCHYTNDSTMLLRQHMRLHKPKQEFECSLCDHIAESSESLQDHMIQHCKVRIYQCKLCNCAFNYKSQLRAHMRMHNDQDILLCDFCDFETRSVSALKAHTKSHLTKPPYKCELCKEEFITSFNLRIHKREGCYTSIDKGGNFKCDECEYTTMNRREMKTHQRLHMGKSTIPTKKRCPYCDNVAITIEQIQQHIADVHGESKPLKCEMCGFVAVSIRSLKSHMKRHVNDQRFVAQPLEQYKCNLCGYVCHHLPSLKSHMWRHAADEHYSYEFTNDVINAAIDFDGQTEAVDTTLEHLDNFKQLIFDKMKAKGLEHTRPTEEESALACCWVTFRCCQCGFETINKAELNMHMADHSDVIKWTLDVPEDSRSKKSKQVTQILHG